MYLAKMNIKDVIFHLCLEKWVLHDAGWFRREPREFQASISCNHQGLEVEISINYPSPWKNSLFHSGSQVGRRNEVTFKLSGASFQATYAFFFVLSAWTFQNVFVMIPVPTPHSLTLHQRPDLHPLTCLILFPSATLAPWEPSIVF